MNNNSRTQLETLCEKHNETFPMSKREFRAYLRQSLRYLSRIKKLYSKGPDQPSSLEAETNAVIWHLAHEESKIRTIASWRKLRRAVSVLYYVLGRKDLSARISATKNPIPPKDRPRKTGRDKRLTTVTSEDFETMCVYLKQHHHFFAHSLCVMARTLGLRPCEMPDITFVIGDHDIRITVPPRKNTRKGAANPRFQRGIGRELVVARSPQLEYALRDCREYKLTRKDVRLVQEQIRRASLALWPRRSARFCLYSLRYTLGSRLKAAYAGVRNGAIQIAAVLGHKCTSSARSYGNIRSSGGGLSVPLATEETCARVVDDCKQRRQQFAKKRIASPAPSQAPIQSLQP